METRYRLFVTVVEVLTFPCAAHGQIMIRRAPTPEPANITELRSGLKLGELSECPLPSAPADSSWTLKDGPDSHFQISLPPGWILERSDYTGGLINDLPRATFRSATENRISVTRRPYTPEGLPFIPDATGVVEPEMQCQVTSGTAGSFWSLYSGIRNKAGKMVFEAIGDGVNRDGKRYGIDIVAVSKAARDSLVSFAARAILLQRPGLTNPLP